VLIRNLVWFTLAATATSSCFGAYSARLFFKNATTNNQAAGQVLASPGDTIEVWYSFHASDAVNPFKWGTFQATLCFDGLTLVSAADQANWDASIATAKTTGGPATDFLATVIGNGELRDNAIDPTDPNSPKLCNNGIYVLLGINGNKGRASQWDVKVWQFTVKAGSFGNTLDWLVDGRDTGTGLSTGILDQKNVRKDITDNHVTVVVPEPGTLAAIATGLAGLAALRRRK
jgi:hypothetical protein